MGKRILVADDSLTIQKAFAMVLGGQDYALLAADQWRSSGRRQGARPDLIIADAVLGNGSGYDLCASVKADPALHSRARAHFWLPPRIRWMRRARRPRWRRRSSAQAV